MPAQFTLPRGTAERIAHMPFPEQIEFLRRKYPLPSERWDDIKQAANDRGFIVAGAQTADLLQDLLDAVDKAIDQGGTLEQFRKDFDKTVARNGWTGWTGEGTQAGRDWRTRVIYQTNLNTSYAAGRLKQLRDPDLIKRKPYWMYRHNDSVQNPRPLHVAWNYRVLPADHPWFATHYPPNGWGCQCYIIAVSLKDAERWGASIITDPPDDGIDTRTGAPRGIDRGWGYMPGARTGAELEDFVGEKLIKLSPAIASALQAYAGPHLQAKP